MAVTEAERLRQRLGETVPPGGTADDTLFTDEAIDDLLTRHDGDFIAAVREGWGIKAAELANLVNTNESGTSRSMSQLYKNALEMVNFYGGNIDVVDDTSVNSHRVKIHRISRGDGP